MTSHKDTEGGQCLELYLPTKNEQTLNGKLRTNTKVNTQTVFMTKLGSNYH